jgi:uncharacterized protein
VELVPIRQGERQRGGPDDGGAGKELRGVHDVLLAERPQVCRDFECEWLTRRDLSRQLRPDLVGTILMEDADSDEYRAVCAPEKPMAWRHPRVFAHLVAVAKSGRIVVAKAGMTSWRIFASGEWGPTV